MREALALSVLCLRYSYVGLFPMLMRMLPPDSTELAGLLKAIADPEELWAEYGLRSLSKSSSIYNKHNTEHDAPYWRAPIWLNINFLALSALRHYSQVKQICHLSLHRHCLPSSWSSVQCTMGPKRDCSAISVLDDLHVREHAAMHCRSLGGTSRLQQDCIRVFGAESSQMFRTHIKIQDTYGKTTGTTLGRGRDPIPSLGGLL